MSSLPESLLHFRTDLEDAIRRELEAQATARSNGWGARVLRSVQRRPGRTTLAFAAVAGAAAAALFVSGPWKTPPGLLEEVQAALTPEGSILHMKWELTSTSRDLACTVTHGPNEIWIDQTPPRRYRVLLNEHFGSADLRALVCSGGTVAELGGTFDPGPKARKPPGFDPSGPARRPTLRFVPPNTLSSSFGNWPFYFGDPVADLREWLSSGRAYDEGTMQLDGRTVKRIRIDPPSFCPFSSCPRKPNYAYVDPETFYPIQIECEDCGGIRLRGRVLRLHMVTRFLTYEPLLPRTAANLALTDIRAQHPDATWTTEPVLFLPQLSGAVAKTVRAAKGAKSARVTFDVTATAGDGGDLPVSCQPRSGSRFPLGKTFVQCGATDAGGSTATAEFTVTVKRRR